MLRFLTLAVIVAASILAQSQPAQTGLAEAQPKSLDIYWIDTEGDAATLIVTNTGQSLLIDSGSSAADDRDAKRIFDVASKEAGLKKIDYLLTTHFAPDHAGGAPALAKLIPIEHFLDHGDSIDTSIPEGSQLFDEYKKTAGTKRRVLKAGDRIPLTGAEVIAVASNGAVIKTPGPPIEAGAAANPLCAKEKIKPADTSEDARSVGIYLRYNKFRYLNLADLPWERELALACPVNNLGTVNLFDASAHGFDKNNSGAPAFLYAIDPQIVVINNAEHKGLNAQAWDEISRAPHVQGIWQEHVSLDVPNELTKHNTRGVMIANTSASVHGFWLKASVSPASNVTITNSRNGYTEVYAPR